MDLIDGKYRKVNLQSEWTLRAGNYAKQILNKVMNDAATIAGLDGAEAAKLLLKMELENGLLALLYIEKDEMVFNPITFEARAEAFLDIPFTEELNSALVDFFTTKASSVVKGIQTYFEAMVPTRA